MSQLFASGGRSIGVSAIVPPNEYSGLISFRIIWFDLLAVQGTLKSLEKELSDTDFSVCFIHSFVNLTTILLTACSVPSTMLFTRGEKHLPSCSYCLAKAPQVGCRTKPCPGLETLCPPGYVAAPQPRKLCHHVCP